jgi:glycosyltransferase involved in cell wall biosynthesis
MRIAFFTDAYWPRVNGVTVSVYLYSHTLARLGHKVAIFCPHYPKSDVFKPEPEESGEGYPQIIKVPSMISILSKEDRLAKFTRVRWVSDKLDNFAPDILHINSEFTMAEFAFHYARLRKLPVVYTFHTLWEEYISNYIPNFSPFLLRFVVRTIFRSFLKRVDMIIAPTKDAEQTIKRYKVNKEIKLLPTGIDSELFKRQPDEAARFRAGLEARYPALRGKRILLYAGRIAKEKNLSFLLEIFSEIALKHPETALLLVGNGPELDALKKESRRHKIEDRCVFTGYMERGDLALAYAMSAIFLFPSLTETQGLVTIEAMMSGLPVIAIGSNGTKMVMNGDNGGFMVRDDPVEFSEKILLLLEDAALYREKAEEAKRHAEHWSIDRMAETLIEIYEQTRARFAAPLSRQKGKASPSHFPM